ncbi:MAG: DUF401 family protein [Clostridiales bacterium]
MELLKLAIVFALILVFLGLRKPLWLVMIGGAILLGLIFQMPPDEFLLDYGQSLISWQTWELVLILWFIMILEGIMSTHGYMQRMLSAMDNLFHSKKVDIVTLPMLIGFLPSAGGALFSAPMVEKSAEGSNLSPETKSIINIHFRHVMETFFPTYPGIILAAQLAGIPLFSLMGIMFPITIFIFCIGLFFVRQVQNQPPAEDKTKDKTPLTQGLCALFRSMWPFFLLIAQITILRISTWLAALITLVALLILVKPTLKQLPKLLRQSTKWKILLMVFSVLAFKDILYASGAVANLPQIISDLPIPAYLVFSLSTLIAAIITGMEMPAISLTMPLALAAMPNAALLPLAGLMILSAYVGAQITPMHLCITIVAEYFQANLQKVLLKSLPMYLIIYGVGLAFYHLIR